MFVNYMLHIEKYIYSYTTKKINTLIWYYVCMAILKTSFYLIGVPSQNEKLNSVILMTSSNRPIMIWYLFSTYNIEQ